MKILITGGAGYIGSHVTKKLLEDTNYSLTVIDNLSTGKIETLEVLQNIRPFQFIKLDLKEFEKIKELIKNNNFETVLHFAASIVVHESVSNPLKYYMNNTMNTTNLINCSVKFNIKKFIFSSTAAVYGSSNTIISENQALNPINPYGMSKLMSERILQDASNSCENLKYIILRYFNVAGADNYYDKNGILSPRIGENSDEATHLIKIVSECATKKREKMMIFGDNYDTEDGTCVRDYIHVDDLANAHIEAINYLEHNSSDIFNIGYGHGFSVKEVIDCSKRINKVDFNVEVSTKRDGDPAILIADNTKIKKNMNWKPQYDDLHLICKSAFEWERKVK